MECAAQILGGRAGEPRSDHIVERGFSIINPPTITGRAVVVKRKPRRVQATDIARKERHEG
jgi:hypothetical protein